MDDSGMLTISPLKQNSTKIKVNIKKHIYIFQAVHVWKLWQQPQKVSKCESGVLSSDRCVFVLSGDHVVQSGHAGLLKALCKTSGVRPHHRSLLKNTKPSDSGEMAPQAFCVRVTSYKWPHSNPSPTWQPNDFLLNLFLRNNNRNGWWIQIHVGLECIVYKYTPWNFNGWNGLFFFCVQISSVLHVDTTAKENDRSVELEAVDCK